MALQTTQGTGYSPEEAWVAVRQQAFSAKVFAQSYVTTLQTTSVPTTSVFNFLDRTISLIAFFNTAGAVSGISAYATEQGYVGTLTTDITTAKNAAQACIDWVVANFPSSGGFVQAQTLNADGTRTDRVFTPAQTVGLQTALTAFIATIS